MNKGHGKPVDWWALGILIQEMIHGIDPFDANEAMEIQAKIIQGKIRFPKTFPPDCKSLVKHLVTADLSKRQGNLKNGPADVKNHRWFKTVDFVDLLHKHIDEQIQVPKIASPSDCSNFESWPERTSKVMKVEWNIDPFKDWE